MLAHQPSPLALKKPESSRQKPSQNDELDSDSSLSSLGNDDRKKSTASGIQPSSSLINPELLAESTAFTTRVQEFQEGVRTRMKNKYAQNHKVVVFQENDIVTLRIPKEDRAATDNHRVVVMIQSIPHKGRHQIQTRFGILDRLYPTGELNAVPLVDQKHYKADLLAAPFKSISLHAVVGKIATSNKVAVSCNCKKSCTTQSRCKCQKNNVKCSQYCHNACQDCGNIGPIHEGTEVIVRSRSEDGDNDDDDDDDDDDGEGSAGEMSSRAQLEKPKKRARALTNSNRKRKKITSPTQEEDNEAEGDDTNRQTTLFQY